MDYSFSFGTKYGELTIESQFGEADKLVCICSCGNKKIARLTHLKHGTVKSCGCLLKTTPARVHGTHLKGGTLTYKVWNSMVYRCTSDKAQAFSSYGARGITVCESWVGDHGFENFLRDMGEKPIGLSIDRIDNDLGYSKGNCRWASMTEQSNNRRSNTFLTVGEETLTVSQWSKRYGVRKTTIFERLKRGWEAERAVTTISRSQRASS